MKKRIIIISGITVVLLVVLLTFICLKRANFMFGQKVSDNPKDYQFITIKDGSDKRLVISLGTENIASIFYPQASNNSEDEEYHLDADTAEKVQKLICDYCKVIDYDNDKYWPHTEEYPEMLVLWDVEFSNEDGSFEYQNSGALCYPKRWDDFIAELEGYLH